MEQECEWDWEKMNRKILKNMFDWRNTLLKLKKVEGNIVKLC